MMLPTQPSSSRPFLPKALLSVLLLAVFACASKPTRKYTVDGRFLVLPAGRTHVDLRQLPGETVFDEERLLVEQVQLPSQVRVQLEGDRVVNRDTAWRLTIRGKTGSFPVRALPWVVWIVDTPLTAAESTNLSSLVAVTFDRELISRGGPVSISYGSQPDRRRPIATIPPIR